MRIPSEIGTSARYIAACWAAPIAGVLLALVVLASAREIRGVLGSHSSDSVQVAPGMAWNPVRPPRGTYLVVSVTDNRFHLMRDGQEIRSGQCSTGNDLQLTTMDGRSWTFRTPRGRFSILSKKTNPVWAKPDWAFVEEGIPVPPPGSRDRFERGVLGDYALAIGDGYLIHGTLYQRLLGSPVSHGCIRLGDDDLEAVYRSLPVGSQVYIY